MGSTVSAVPWETNRRGCPCGGAGGDEARREGHHPPEQVAIGQAQRQGVRGAIREAGDRDVLGVDGVVRERPGEGLINEGDIQAEGVEHRVPGAAPAHSPGSPWAAAKRRSSPHPADTTMAATAPPRDSRRRWPTAAPCRTQLPWNLTNRTARILRFDSSCAINIGVGRHPARRKLSTSGGRPFCCP